MKTVLALLLVCAVLPAALGSSDYTWKSCGTRYDRLTTDTLSFTATPGIQAGAKAVVHTTGTTDLHAPLITGAWQVRVYELGFSHDIYTTFGNIEDALQFTDPKNTTYSFTIEFDLPAAKGPQASFTASIISTDQQHATYNCLEIMYSFPSTTAAAPEIAAPEHVAHIAPVAHIAAATKAATKSATRITDGPHFHSCGNATDKLKNVKISFSPSDPKAGDTITISATGTSAETITGGVIKYEAGFDGIPLLHQTKPLCDLVKQAHLKCPIAAGPLKIDLSFNLPGFIPPGTYSATGNGYDQNGDPLLCLTGSFTLS